MRRLLLALALAPALAGCGGSAAHGLPPRDFRPETGAAVGARDVWVLGQGNTLLRSTDAGAHFERVAFPPLPTEGDVPVVEFANVNDGYAFAPGSRLYATSDGGARWRPTGPRAARDVTVSAGYVYGLFGPSNIERSHIGGDSWHQLAVPGGLRWLLSLAANGSDVWLLATPRGALGSIDDRILRSTNRGATFEANDAPCIPGLAGTIVPAGRNVVWAVCPTGMMAGVWFSTDGGRTFPGVRSFHDPGGVGLPLMTNGARVVPFSSRGVVLDGGGDGPLYRTTNGGKRWEKVSQPATIDQLGWLGFATHRLGYALVSTKLWRTTDAGASWRVVPIR